MGDGELILSHLVSIRVSLERVETAFANNNIIYEVWWNFEYKVGIGDLEQNMSTIFLELFFCPPPQKNKNPNNLGLFSSSVELDCGLF